ncbi:prolyl aminopeptidase [Sphingomonas koreensis]|nr:prolyl aminopeptidase [Sphingomonas koreensis]
MAFQDPASGLFRAIEPYEYGWLAVGDGHRVYWERVGRRGGQPAVFLHGGPGGRIDMFHRRLFDPEVHDGLLFDQRGCGRSTPSGSLTANTTAHLVADIERLRLEVMETDGWLVIGGSWGSLLALAYAQSHPRSVHGVVLRGVFLGSRAEMDWFYRSGIDHVFPDKWASFLAAVPEEGRDDLPAAYWSLMASPDVETAVAAARAWAAFEREVSSFEEPSTPEAIDDRALLASARIQLHYFLNDCFVGPGQLTRDLALLTEIPTRIVHGRYDMTCPMKFAWELHAALPEADFRIVPCSGHSAREPSMRAATMGAIADLSRIVGRIAA